MGSFSCRQRGSLVVAIRAKPNGNKTSRYLIPFLNDNRFIGRARHSVRAVVVRLKVWVGNCGGQRTARPTIRTDCYREMVSLRWVIIFGSSRRAGRTSQFQISLAWTLSNGWPAKPGSFDGAHAGTARLHPARAGAGAQHHPDHCAGIVAAFETHPTLTPESGLTKPNPLERFQKSGGAGVRACE
jgi:hypothetical protein